MVAAARDVTRQVRKGGERGGQTGLADTMDITGEAKGWNCGVRGWMRWRQKERWAEYKEEKGSIQTVGLISEGLEFKCGGVG